MSKIVIPRYIMTPGVVARIANALANKHKITIQAGEGWKSDIQKKKLQYDIHSSSSFDDTDSLFACIMHEVSHIKHTDANGVVNDFVPIVAGGHSATRTLGRLHVGDEEYRPHRYADSGYREAAREAFFKALP